MDKTGPNHCIINSRKGTQRKMDKLLFTAWFVSLPFLMLSCKISNIRWQFQQSVSVGSLCPAQFERVKILYLIFCWFFLPVVEKLAFLGNFFLRGLPVICRQNNILFIPLSVCSTISMEAARASSSWKPTLSCCFVSFHSFTPSYRSAGFLPFFMTV